MALQLIYTSSPRLLQAGRTGFGVVAKHPEIRGDLQVQLERISQFSRDPSLDNARVVLQYRILTASGQSHHVFSRIQDAGSDYTGRTNHIAHHFIFSQSEAQQAIQNNITPADVFLFLEESHKWHQSWNDDPIEFGIDDTISLSEIPPRITLPAENYWNDLTGDPASAAILAPGKIAEACWIIYPSDWANYIIYLFGESLIMHPNPWQISFANEVQPTDDEQQIQWRGVSENSPQRANAENSVRDVIDLCHPENLPPPVSEAFTNWATTGQKPLLERPLSQKPPVANTNRSFANPNAQPSTAESPRRTVKPSVISQPSNNLRVLRQEVKNKKKITYWVYAIGAVLLFATLAGIWLLPKGKKEITKEITVNPTSEPTSVDKIDKIDEIKKILISAEANQSKDSLDKLDPLLDGSEPEKINYKSFNQLVDLWKKSFDERNPIDSVEFKKLSELSPDTLQEQKNKLLDSIKNRQSDLFDNSFESVWAEASNQSNQTEFLANLKSFIDKWSILETTQNTNYKTLKNVKDDMDKDNSPKVQTTLNEQKSVKKDETYFKNKGLKTPNFISKSSTHGADSTSYTQGQVNLTPIPPTQTEEAIAIKIAILKSQPDLSNNFEDLDKAIIYFDPDKPENQFKQEDLFNLQKIDRGSWEWDNLLDLIRKNMDKPKEQANTIKNLEYFNITGGQGSIRDNNVKKNIETIKETNQNFSQKQNILFWSYSKKELVLNILWKYDNIKPVIKNYSKLIEEDKQEKKIRISDSFRDLIMNFKNTENLNITFSFQDFQTTFTFDEIKDKKTKALLDKNKKNINDHIAEFEEEIKKCNDKNETFININKFEENQEICKNKIGLKKIDTSKSITQMGIENNLKDSLLNYAKSKKEILKQPDDKNKTQTSIDPEVEKYLNNPELTTYKDIIISKLNQYDEFKQALEYLVKIKVGEIIPEIDPKEANDNQIKNLNTNISKLIKFPSASTLELKSGKDTIITFTIK
jgi:hypothetical protein